MNVTNVQVMMANKNIIMLLEPALISTPIIIQEYHGVLQEIF